MLTMQGLSVLVAGVPVVGAVACAMLTASVLREQGERELSRTAERVAGSLAMPLKELLDQRELSRLRMLVGTAAEQSGLEEVSIELGDGSVIAHSEPSRVTAKEAPAVWPSKAGTGVERAIPGECRRPIQLNDGGEAVLRVRLGTASAAAAAWQDTTLTGGLALIVIAGAVGSVLAGRKAGAMLRPLGAVHSALAAMVKGETRPESLLISARFGPEAAAWNSLLDRRAASRREELDERINAAAGAGRTGDGAMERACDSLPQGLLLLDVTGRVRYANGAACVMLGCKKQELSGVLLGDRLKDARAGAALQSVSGESSARRRASVEVSTGVGEEASVLRYSFFRAGGDGSSPTPVLALIEDLTQQRIADKARDAFVAQATHELRTPLTNIRLYVETLLEDGEQDERRASSLNVINQETRRLERMVSDMLSVAEMEAGSLKLHTDDVRVDALLKELEADYQAQAAEKKVTLAFEMPPKLPVLRGDRDKIAMSLHNLIGNAIKYTPEGGTVTVTAQETPASFMVLVKDTGIGITAEERERIFEKFYRSKDRRVAKITGTGLGLAIARDVIRLHGGDITVDSELDKGSTFTLSIPHTAMAA